jgi:CRISP-associated protein Cas1
LLANVHLNRVRQVVGQGRVGLTSNLAAPFRRKAVRPGVALRLTVGTPPGPPLLEYEAVTDPAAALPIARQVVAGKIANMRSGLLRAARSQDHPDIAGHADWLAAARLSALETDSALSLLGYEGTATRDYFAGSHWR